jgi:hypothetical protein
LDASGPVCHHPEKLPDTKNKACSNGMERITAPGCIFDNKDDRERLPTRGAMSLFVRQAMFGWTTTQERLKQ